MTSTVNDSSRSGPQGSRAWNLAAVAGAVGVLAYAVLALIQIQILNPLAAMPELSLAEIHAAARDRHQSMQLAATFLILLPGPVVAAILAAGACCRMFPGWIALAGQVVLLILGAPASVIASFGPGMSLADTFMISGWDASHAALYLYGASAIALLLSLVGVAVWGARAIRRVGDPIASS